MRVEVRVRAKVRVRVRVKVRVRARARARARVPVLLVAEEVPLSEVHHFRNRQGFTPAVKIPLPTEDEDYHSRLSLAYSQRLCQQPLPM